MIKIKTPRCPECDEPAGAVEESLLAWTTLRHEGGNEFEWAGWTEVSDNTNEPLSDGSKVLVRCANKHEWKASFQETN